MITDSVLDCWLIVGRKTAQLIDLAAEESHQYGEDSPMAERAREDAGYGGLSRHAVRAVR